MASRVPKASAEMVAAAVRTVLAQPDAAHVRCQLAEVTTMLRPQSPRSPACSTPPPTPPRLRQLPPGALAEGVVDEPARAAQRRDQAAHQRRRHFPNDAAIARLVTAVVVEAHNEWAVAERRYLSEEFVAELHAPIPDTLTEETPLAVTA